MKTFSLFVTLYIVSLCSFAATSADHRGHDHGETDVHVGHEDHEGHDHEDHSGDDHEDHSGDDHEDHSGHDHEDHSGHDHEDHSGDDHEDHSGHDHEDHSGDDHEEHSGHDHEDHSGHNHGEIKVHNDHEDHEGHDHGEEGEVMAIELSSEMIEKSGIQIGEAQGGQVARISTFPVEIKLNRDRMAAVSPRFPSLIRQVFAEIGDEVKKGDVLASLENRETLSVYTVSAPLDGVIISKDLAVGESADGDRILYEVADLSSVWADISVFPKYQHSLKKGMAVRFVAHDGHEAEGDIQYISPIASHETRTFTARSILENPPEDFTPGMFVRAEIPVQSVDAKVAVPRGAVQEMDGEQVIFVPGPHGFEVIEVRCGLADDEQIEILSGLEPGQPYVAKGAFVLKSQMVIQGMDPHAGHGH